METNQSTTEIAVVESNDTALYLLTKAEVDTQIATAKAFPRDIKKAMANALAMATINEDVAESCNFAVPRKKKNDKTGQWETVFIEGKSVRLAEIIACCFGNMRSGSRIIANDGKTITAQGICHDLETNNVRTIEVKRKITDSKGKTYNEDLQTLAGNAAGSIAFRNAVFSVVPGAIVDGIYEKTRELSRGTLASLKEKRDKALAFFAGKDITAEQVCEILEVKTVDEIDLNKLSILRGMVTLIKNGEGTLKDLFEKKTTEPSVETKEAVSTAMDDLERVKHNTGIRNQIRAKEEQRDKISDMGSTEYLTLTKEIEELETQIKK